MLRVACVRFWLSRLIAAESFAGQDVLIHDPAEFEHRLAQRQQVDDPAAVRALKLREGASAPSYRRYRLGFQSDSRQPAKSLPSFSSTCS